MCSGHEKPESSFHTSLPREQYGPKGHEGGRQADRIISTVKHDKPDPPSAGTRNENASAAPESVPTVPGVAVSPPHAPNENAAIRKASARYLLTKSVIYFSVSVRAKDDHLPVPVL
jgi:hypothetical protein